MHNKRVKKTKSALTYLLLFVFWSGTIMAKQTLWFGSYTDEKGKTQQGRYQIGFEGSSNRIISLRLAPYGKPPVNFKIIEHDIASGFLSAEWPGNPNKKCNFFRYAPTYYSGNWIEGTSVQPMTFKQFNGQDAELQGNWFKPGNTEIEIIESAMQKLNNEIKWDKSDNRICTSNSKLSVFCALYRASIDIDDEYRHLRPAINAVREAIEQRHPGEYDHVLVDFNNAKNITLEEVNHVFNLARTNLALKIKQQKSNN